MQKSVMLFVTVFGAVSVDAGTITFNTLAASSVEGSPFSGILTSFNNTVTSDPIVDYSATINWGDGSTTAPSSIVGGGGSYAVNASHTYATAGTYTVIVDVTDADGPTNGSGTGTATVADAPLTLGTVPTLTFDPGASLMNVVVASFTDGDTTTSSPTDYSATINWGDGSPAIAGSFVGMDGAYNLFGSHTYAVGGSYIISGTINDFGGSTLSFTTQAMAAPEPGSIAMVCMGLALVGLRRVRRG